MGNESRTSSQARAEEPERPSGPAFRKPGTGSPAEYNLRMVDGTPGTYLLLNQFEYVEPDYVAGTRKPRSFTVPVDEKGLVTDLASIPFFATWLVPKDGKHTPAAFLHDALVRDRTDKRTVQGPPEPLSRHEADRIFRRAMQELGVPPIRRALMWAAVNLGTLMKVGPGWRRAYWSALVAATAVASLIFNLVWVNDWFDGSVDWAADLWGISWIVDRLQSAAHFAQNHLGFLPDSHLVLAGLAALAVTILWGRRLGAGWLTAGAIMLFGYPLLVAAFSFGVYWLIEKGWELLTRAARTFHLPSPRGPINPPGILRKMSR